MAIIKSERFKTEDIYLDYDFEEVMFRYEHTSKNIYRKFYGKEESSEIIDHSNRLFCDALRFGNEVSKEQYEEGKQKR